MHASPHRRGAARRPSAFFSPSYVLSLPLSSRTNEIVRSCYRGRPIRALARPGSDGIKEKRRRYERKTATWKPPRNSWRRSFDFFFFFFLQARSKGVTRPGRPSIDKSRKDDGPDRCFRQREVRPCALISNGFTEGPAADDATAGQYCRFPDPFALLPPRIHYRGGRFLSRRFIKEHTAPSLPPLSPPRSPLSTPSELPVLPLVLPKLDGQSLIRKPRLIRFLRTVVLRFERANISF